MSIISKETFEKFTKEEKEKIRKDYRNSLEEINNDDSEADVEYKTYVAAAEMYFGKENLQPKPKIKTWEDINKMDNRYHQIIDEIIRSGYSSLWDSKVINKIIATLKISKIIEFGYGGMITDEEWKDESLQKWCVIVDYKDPTKLANYMTDCNYQFIAFHNPQQREEFMSYPENRKLVKQYYMI